MLKRLLYHGDEKNNHDTNVNIFTQLSKEVMHEIFRFVIDDEMEKDNSFEVMSYKLICKHFKNFITDPRCGKYLILEFCNEFQTQESIISVFSSLSYSFLDCLSIDYSFMKHVKNSNVTSINKLWLNINLYSFSETTLDLGFLIMVNFLQIEFERSTCEKNGNLESDDSDDDDQVMENKKLSIILPKKVKSLIINHSLSFTLIELQITEIIGGLGLEKLTILDEDLKISQCREFFNSVKNTLETISYCIRNINMSGGMLNAFSSFSKEFLESLSNLQVLEIDHTFLTNKNERYVLDVSSFPNLKSIKFETNEKQKIIVELKISNKQVNIYLKYDKNQLYFEMYLDNVLLFK